MRASRLIAVVLFLGLIAAGPGTGVVLRPQLAARPATPDPRSYITVISMGNDIAAVQYQWRQGQDPACCPTGIGTVRFKIEDGKLEARDPIPNP